MDAEFIIGNYLLDINLVHLSQPLAFKNMEQLSEHPLEQDLADMRRLKEEYPNKVLIASIMGETLEDWTNLAKLVTEAGADMIELNFSCPQMTSHTMGSDVGTNPELCKKNCEAVKRGRSEEHTSELQSRI